MFMHIGAWIDQVVQQAPGAFQQNGFSLVWVGIALYALRSFRRWGTYP